MSSTNAKMMALITVASQIEDLTSIEATALLGAILPNTDPAQAVEAARVVRHCVLSGGPSSPKAYMQAAQAALADRAGTDLIWVGEGVPL